MAQTARELNAKSATEVSALTVKVDVDIAEVIRGLKAVQREAKKAAQALRDLEAARNCRPNADLCDQIDTNREVSGA